MRVEIIGAATPKRRLAVVYDYTPETQWAVIDMAAALATAPTWEQAEALRKKIEAGGASDGGAVWNPKSGGY